MIAPIRRGQLIGRRFLARNGQAATMGRAPPWGCYPWDLEEFQYLLRIRRRRPRLNRGHGLMQSYMPEDLRNQRRVLDTGDDPQCSATIGTGLDIDGENTLEALHPTHGCHGFIAVHRATRPARHDPAAVFEVRRENAVKSGEVEPRPGNQGGQPGDDKSAG